VQIGREALELAYWFVIPVGWDGNKVRRRTNINACGIRVGMTQGAIALCRGCSVIGRGRTQGSGTPFLLILSNGMQSIAQPLTRVDDVTHDHANERVIRTVESSVFRLRSHPACHNQ